MLEWLGMTPAILGQYLATAFLALTWMAQGRRVEAQGRRVEALGRKVEATYALASALERYEDDLDERVSKLEEHNRMDLN